MKPSKPILDSPDFKHWHCEYCTQDFLYKEYREPSVCPICGGNLHYDYTILQVKIDRRVLNGKKT